MAYKRFIGPNNGSWNTASSWSPSGIPGVDDEVVFESSKTISGNPTTVLNLIVMPGVALMISTSTAGTSMSIRGNLTNNGKLSTNTMATINFTGSSAPAYIYSNDGPYGFNFSFNKDGQTIYLDSNINLYSSTSAVWTSSQGILNYNAGNWQMNGYTFQARRLTMGSGFKGWYLNGNLLLRNATTNNDYIILSSPATLYENTGRIILDTIRGTGSYKYALSQLSNSYENAINFTITGPLGTNSFAPNAGAHYKNLIVGNASLSNGTWNIHDSFTTSNTQTSLQSITNINFYANNGQTAIFNSSQPWTKVDFLQYSGTNSVHEIQRSQAISNNLNTNNITYYLNHSAGTGQTFNCNSTNSTYYIKITGNASAVINCNGNNSTYYLGWWNNNIFSQTCGAYTLNCGTAGSNSIFNYDNITDNIAAPCNIFAGAARGSTSVGGGIHNISSGTNIAGSFNFNGGILNIINDSPVVGTFNSCTAANNANPRTINWNGRYIRVNNQARNLNVNGTGSVGIYAANINTINSDMGLGDNYDGGIQMESSGLIQVGLWNATTCPRLKLVALGTGQSARSIGSSYIRSIEIYGALYVSGTGARFINPTARITWNENGTTADFRQFYPQLASISGGSFSYGNNSSAITDQYRLGALITDNVLCGNNQVWDIDKAHIQTLYLTKDSGTWNLNDIIVGGNIKCTPDVASLNTVVFNWNKVVKPATTSNFTGYSTGDNFFLGGGVNCTHNINNNNGVNISSNNLECISVNVPGGIGATTNIGASILGSGSILVSSYSIVKITNNISLLNIDIKPNGYSTGTLQIESDFTLTGSLYNTPASSGSTAKLLFNNRTITFTGTNPINITRPLATGSDLTNSNMIIRSISDNRIIRISDNTTIWGTITNACTFVHTGGGNGIGWLEIRAGSDTGQAPTINNIVSENTTVSRGFKFVKPSGAGAKFTVNNANGMSGGGYTTVSYIQGDIYATYNPTLSWLGIKNSNVKTIVNSNWLADSSIDYGSNTGWTINEPPRQYPSYVGFLRFF